MESLTPYGFGKIGKGVLGPVGEEIAVIKYMHRLYLEEGLGLGSVAKRLDDEGIRTRCGNIWYADGVKKAMFHEALLGKIAYGKTRIVKVPSGDGLEMVKKRIRGNLIVRNAHDPVISDDRLQNLLDELKRRREMRRGASVLSPKVYVLSGILVCDYCGGPLYAKGTRMSRKGDTLYYYQCYNHQKAGTCQSNFSSRKLEAQAESLLREMVMAVDPSTFVDHYLAQHNPGDTPEDVEARLRGLLEKQKRLQDGYLGGVFSLTAFKELQAELEEQIRALEAAKVTLEAVQGRATRKSVLLEWLADLMSGDAPLDSVIPRQKLKLIYRELFESMNVRDGVIVSCRPRA